MKIIRKSDVTSEPGKTFTGDVTMDRILDAQEAGGLRLNTVHFNDGARTFWHIHPGEQVLVVLSGKGRVGTAEEQFEIAEGDVVYLPPQERHWHGAAPGHSMTHMSITTKGAPTWFEPPED